MSRRVALLCVWSMTFLCCACCCWFGGGGGGGGGGGWWWHSHAFYTSPLPFDAMPADVKASLGSAAVVVIKGQCTPCCRYCCDGHTCRARLKYVFVIALRFKPLKMYGMGGKQE